MHTKTKWVKAEEALRASQKELRRLAEQHLTIQETERRRIAADLHDGLGQSLSLLKLGIQEALRQMGPGVPRKAVESVRQLIPKVASALDEVRRVAMDLRPSTLDDLGIIPTLSWFVREFEIANPDTRIEKHISVIENDVPEPLKLAIFRIMQEAVNNAVKHADALADGGDARSGLGLQSMRERAEISGGTYAVISALGQGTKVCILWPVSKATDSARDQAGFALPGLQHSAPTGGAQLPAIAPGSRTARS
jgi:signal transduction histidine kinase